MDSEDGSSAKKRKVAPRTAKPVSVAARFMAADISEVKQVRRMLKIL